MSARGQLDVLEVVNRYAAGYFPLYDVEGKFYWERLGIRAILPVNAGAAARARHVAKRAAGGFEIRYSTAVKKVIEHLRDEREGGVKHNSWVKEEVVRIYGALHGAGLLKTIEAWDVGGGKSEKVKRDKGGGAGKVDAGEAGKQERLVGGLVGIVLPGTFIAETMFGLAPEASKVCLCRLVEDCAAAGFEMIDVQTPHDLDELGRRVRRPGRTAHPCVRLGEQTVTLAAFIRAFAEAWKRRFAGGVRDWVEAAMEVKRRGRGIGGPLRGGDGLPAETMQQAERMLMVR